MKGKSDDKGKKSGKSDAMRELREQLAQQREEKKARETPPKKGKAK